MGADFKPPNGPPRRIEVLAFIVDRIVRTGSCPSYEDIGRSMEPRVNKSRVAQLVQQLVTIGVIERDAGAQRGIRIPDLARCREMIDTGLQDCGWWHAKPKGTLEAPPHYTFVQLPMVPPFEDYPPED